MSTQPTLSESVSQEIRVRLAQRRMSQSELARQCGWIPQYLRRRMTGEIPFSTDEIEKIAFILNMSTLELTNPVQR